jgi:hypothetical protein
LLSRNYLKTLCIFCFYFNFMLTKFYARYRIQTHFADTKAVLMTHVVHDGLIKAFANSPWMLLPARHKEVVSELAEALGPDWVVEREIDFEGEVSIIALPIIDAAPAPTFILYEKAGRAHVATIRFDRWENDRGYNSFQQATDAFVAEARASAMRV